MIKTAKYKNMPVYICFINEKQEYALISYNKDKTKQFKVNIEELLGLVLNKKEGWE